MKADAKIQNAKWKIAWAAMSRLWQGFREWSGDAAYERYLECAARQPAVKVLSPEEFYVQQLERKYSRASRCC